MLVGRGQGDFDLEELGGQLGHFTGGAGFEINQEVVFLEVEFTRVVFDFDADLLDWHDAAELDVDEFPDEQGEAKRDQFAPEVADEEAVMSMYARHGPYSFESSVTVLFFLMARAPSHCMGDHEAMRGASAGSGGSSTLSCWWN